jgi:hypothetical protein
VTDAVAKENSAIEIIKSALVIPLVIILVLGTGWGLVRWGAVRQAASGKPDPQPTEKGPDGSLTLQIPFAQLSGEMHYGGGGRHRAVGNWKQADENVAWRINVEKPGRYAVELECACDSANAGSVVRIEIGTSPLQVTVPDTGGPRTFTTIRAGNVEIPSAGWRDLRIVPVTIAHNSVMILRSVRLVPIGTSS